MLLELQATNKRCLLLHRFDSKQLFETIYTSERSRQCRMFLEVNLDFHYLKKTKLGHIVSIILSLQSSSGDEIKKQGLEVLYSDEVSWTNRIPLMTSPFVNILVY